MASKQTTRAVRFDHYGGIDVLHLEEIERPAPGKGQVLVRVRAAGINPGEAAIREGKMAKQFPSTFPSGEGSDLAGVVEELGPDVRGIAIGDEIIGFSNQRSSHAELVLVQADELTPRPARVPWEQAGALFVVGTTAWAAVKAVALQPGDVVVVSGAAGGVGTVAVQLAQKAGANVFGLAGEGNHDWLRRHGITPVLYGEGMEERLRAVTGNRIDAFIDTFGGGYVEMAIRMGVAPERIDTIIDFEAAKRFGVKTDGNAAGAKASVLAELAAMIAKGELEIPIAGVYQLADVQKAYTELEKRHTRGKIVLVP